MRLSELVAKIPYRLVGNPPPDYLQRTVKKVSADAFSADEGTLFVCTRTPLRDGHDMALIAYERGCRLFLAERSLPLGADAVVMVTEGTEARIAALAAACYGYPARRMTVFGITGSVGKSSVALLTAALLRRAGYVVATVTTDGVDDGDGLCRYPGGMLPDGAALQRILLDLAERGVAFAILEISAYMLSRKTHFSIPFTAVLLTGVDKTCDKAKKYGEEHYLELKASLFVGDAPFWVLPANFVDAFGPCHGRCLTVGEGGDYYAEIRLPILLPKGFGTLTTLVLEQGQKIEISLPVPGDMGIENALSAAALARIAGVSEQVIAEGLSTTAPMGRMHCIAAHKGRLIYEDNAYSAERLTQALQLLRTRTEGKLTVVIGSVGGRSRQRRVPLGYAATAYADLAYFTADNADLEDPAEICAQMLEEADPDRYVVLPDRERCIRRAVLEMRPGDTLLLAGKGGEDFQLVGGQRERFSTTEIVWEILRSL